jgi:hypothetical protein
MENVKSRSFMPRKHRPQTPQTPKGDMTDTNLKAPKNRLDKDTANALGVTVDHHKCENDRATASGPVAAPFPPGLRPLDRPGFRKASNRNKGH